MAWVQVQKKSGSAAADNATATLDSTPVNGNLLIACCRANANATVTIPTWTSIIQSGTTRSAILYKIASSDGTGVTATCTGATLTSLFVFEYSGHDPSPVDGAGTTVSVTVSGTAGVLPAITPAMAGELYICTMSTSGSVTAPGFNTEAFNLEGIGNSAQFVGSYINSGTGAVGTTATWTTSRTGTGKLVAFKPAAGVVSEDGGWFTFA